MSKSTRHIDVRDPINYDKLRHALVNKRPRQNLVDKDPSINMQNLIEMINTARDEVAPARQGKFKRHVHKVNPWITKGILNSIKFKDNLYKKYLKTPSF